MSQLSLSLSLKPYAECLSLLVSFLLPISEEIRTHGVGYYAFSQEEEKRAEQLSLLNKLRDQVGVHIASV